MNIEIMQEKLAKLEAKLASLVKPSFIDDAYFDMYLVDSRGLNQIERNKKYEQYQVKFQLDSQDYTHDRKALETAISHFQKMIDIDYALSLID